MQDQRYHDALMAKKYQKVISLSCGRAVFKPQTQHLDPDRLEEQGKADLYGDIAVPTVPGNRVSKPSTEALEERQNYLEDQAKPIGRSVTMMISQAMQNLLLRQFWEIVKLVGVCQSECEPWVDQFS